MKTLLTSIPGRQNATSPAERVTARQEKGNFAYLFLSIRQFPIHLVETLLVRAVQGLALSWCPIPQTPSTHLAQHRKCSTPEVIGGASYVDAVAPLLGHHPQEQIRRRSRVGQ
jgi:hypothetical protein